MSIIHYRTHSATMIADFYKRGTEDGSDWNRKTALYMHQFMEMANGLVDSNAVLGCTSHHDLILMKDGEWPGVVTVKADGNGNYRISYCIPEKQSPWRGAEVVGTACNMEEARKLLSICMLGSQGWQENEKLTRLLEAASR